MALQSTGQIDFSDVNVELGLAGTTQISLGQASVRTLYGISAGAIRLAADGYGKSNAPVYITYSFDTAGDDASWTAGNANTTVDSAVSEAQFEANTGSDIFGNITESVITGGRRLQFPNANALFRFTRTAYSGREVTITANIRRVAGTGSITIDYGDAASPPSIAIAELPINTYTVVSKSMIAGANGWLDFPNDGNYNGWTLDIDYIQVNVTGMLTLISAANDPFLRRTGLSFSGLTYKYIKVRIRRIAGSTWDGSVYYTTASHGESELYKNLMTEPVWDGTFKIISIDMSSLVAGGTDWVSNTITGIRFDFGLLLGDDFEIDYIQLSNVA